MTTAEKEAINAACTIALSNLAADLTGRNASEALDDPIAVTAAGNAAAQAVRDAWNNVCNLEARAPETFAGTGPGGFAMAFAGFTGWFDGGWINWGGIGAGLYDGGAMMLNAVTFHQIDSVDAYVDGVIEENGGAYGTANVFAHIGVYAAELAGVFLIATVASSGGTAVIGDSTTIGIASGTLHAWLSANRLAWSTGQNFAWIQSVAQSRMIVRLAQPFMVTNTAAATTGLWTTWEIGLLQQAGYVRFFHWWLPPLI